jgi:branched-chain amino acid aminotransferase
VKILYNHRLYPASAPLVGASNRGLRYGDGVFETLKIKDGVLLLAGWHFERLWKGLHALRFDIPTHFTPPWLEGEILRLCRKNGHAGLGRVRLNLFRGDGGVNDPISHHPHYLIETFALERAFTPPDSHGLDIGVFPDGRKAADAFANLKSNNYLVYLMGAAWAKTEKLNECLILNTEDRVADGSISNLFFVRQGEICTPPLTEGGVAGILRRYLLEMAPQWGWNAREVPVTPAELQNAEEIFFTNAITGIRWVRQFGEYAYGHTLSAALGKRLEESF